MKLTGQIIKAYGRRFVVETSEGHYDCTTRGKRVDYVCGDWVEVLVQNAEQAVIESAQERRSLLYRQDDWKTKLIAANVTRIVFVTAAVPTPSEELLARCLVAAEVADIEPLILVNKAELPETAVWMAKLQRFADMGYPVLALSALEDIEPLRPWLKGHTTVLVGQSGMGKSTLTNALLPEARARVGDISTALDSGRHTTTHAELYHLDEDSQLIDSPGLQAFGLHHVEPADLLHYLPDLRRYIGQCRFHNCTHRQEPDCAIKQAVSNGELSQARLEFLQRLSNELLAK